MIYALVDAKYLCHRARFSIKGLSFKQMPTSVAYGFLQELRQIEDLINPDVYVFAFDSARGSKRRHLYPDYKKSRREGRENLTEAEKEEHELFYEQVNRLQQEILPKLGYSNVFEAPGYEGDDIIARVAQEISINDEAYIVSSDGDFFQCLRRNVSMYFPSKPTKPAHIYTSEQFYREWQLRPEQWATVKALAGCTTDDVEGVAGIGETYAARWVRGDLKKGKTYEKIEAGVGVLARNLPLVTLPFEGTPMFEIKPDESSSQREKAVMQELGFGRKGKQRRRTGFDL